MAAISDQFPADVPALVPVKRSGDTRGVFAKPLEVALRDGVDFRIAELFWTTSSRACIRGMHFQSPPWATRKLVWVTRGRILDVVVDLRPGDAYGTIHSFEMAEDLAEALYIPAGFAHGFQALVDDATVNYAVDREYAPRHDDGIRWDSFGFDWPLPPGEISARDRALPTLADYVTPFGPRR